MTKAEERFAACLAAFEITAFFDRMKSPCDYTAIDFIYLYLIMVKLFGLIIRLAGHIYTKLSEHLIVHARQNNA